MPYNLANPKSSYRRSIVEADAVYCTNWNAYEPFNGEMRGMTRDAHQSRVLIKSQADRVFDINPQAVDPVGTGFAGCKP